MQVFTYLIVLGIGVFFGWIAVRAKYRLPTKRERMIVELYKSLPQSVIDVLEDKPLSGLTVYMAEDTPATEFIRLRLLEAGATLAENKTDADLRISILDNIYGYIRISDRHNNTWTTCDICKVSRPNDYQLKSLDEFIAQVTKEIALARMESLVRHYREQQALAELELNDPAFDATKLEVKRSG